MSKQNRQKVPLNPVIIGTAGHIDHGKSALIKALTGTDPDRLLEEKRRGITIELGFAFMGENIAFIDVPGHERFVKHMVAGAATVDHAMLVIAADDGVMPQTREHLDILNLLDVQGGLVVITKADVAEEELLQLVQEDVAETLVGTVLEQAPVFVVDSLTGRGIPAVRKSLKQLTTGERRRVSSGSFRMPVDRVFTMKGFGTVVTGSVLSGSASSEDRLELLPAGRQVRVKGIQSHGSASDTVSAGMRAAINLTGVSVDAVSRGDVLASAGLMPATQMMYGRVKLLATSPMPLKNNVRVRFHLGTADLLARIIPLEGKMIAPGEQGYVRIKLESPAVALRGDRFVLRRYSPLITIGGGVVLEGAPDDKRRRRGDLLDLLTRLDNSDLRGLVYTAVDRAQGNSVDEAAEHLRRDPEEVSGTVSELLTTGELASVTHRGVLRLITDARFEELITQAEKALQVYHRREPLSIGMPLDVMAGRLRRLLTPELAALALLNAVALGRLQAPTQGRLAQVGFSVELAPARQETARRLEQGLYEGAMAPPSVDELAELCGASPSEVGRLLPWLIETGRAIRLMDKLYFSTAALKDARVVLQSMLSEEGSSVSQLREAFNTSRKFMVPLLERFDQIGWTRRRDNLRFAGSKLFDDASDD